MAFADPEAAKAVFGDLVREMIEQGMTPLMLRAHLDGIIASSSSSLNVAQMIALGRLLFPDANWQQNKAGTRAQAYVTDLVRIDILRASKAEAYEFHEGKWLRGFSCMFYGKGTIERVWGNMRSSRRAEFPTGERVVHATEYGNWTEVLKKPRPGFGNELHALWLARHNQYLLSANRDPIESDPLTEYGYEQNIYESRNDDLDDDAEGQDD